MELAASCHEAVLRDRPAPEGVSWGLVGNPFEEVKGQQKPTCRTSELFPSHDVQTEGRGVQLSTWNSTGRAQFPFLFTISCIFHLSFGSNGTCPTYVPPLPNLNQGS